MTPKAIWAMRFMIVIFALTCAGAAPAADAVHVVTEIWPPFRIADSGGSDRITGIDADLLTEIGGRMDVTFTVRRLPWARCLDFMRTGEADLITGLAYTPERAAYIHYIQPPYYTVSPAFYLRKGRGHLIKTYEDLRGVTIGYSINSAYFEPFNSDAGLKKIGVSAEQQLIRMLAHGHIEAMIGTDCNVAYDLAEMGLTEAIEKAAYQPDAHTELYVGVSKKSPFSSRLEVLGRVMRALVQSGAADRMARPYFQEGEKERDENSP